MKYKKPVLILVLIFLLALVFRFLNLLHDAPYFFNPDERNMANAIVQLRLPDKLINIPHCIASEMLPGLISYTTDKSLEECNLNPHFFAYGQLPLYMAYTSSFTFNKLFCYLTNFLSWPLKYSNTVFTTSCTNSISYTSAIYWLRFYSALSSSFTVIVIYLLAKEILNIRFGLIAAFTYVFIPGSIQSAHFGTTESLLSFFYLSSIYISYKIYKSINYNNSKGLWKKVGLLGIVIGLALGTKLTGIFMYIPLATLFLLFIPLLYKKRKPLSFTKQVKRFIHAGLLTFSISVFIGIVTSFYNMIELQDFQSAVFGYESDVATGKYQAFYTKQFVGSLPIIFQLKNIFPFVLGFPLFFLSILGLFIAIVELFLFFSKTILYQKPVIQLLSKHSPNKKRLKKTMFHSLLFIILISFFTYLILNASLFAKWTRFMSPIIPLFAVFFMYFLGKINLLPKLFPKFKKSKAIFNFLIFIATFISALPGIAFATIYIKPDSRLSASKWIYENIENNSYILSETANVVDIPLGMPKGKNPMDKNYQVVSFDFYHLDENKRLVNELINHLAKADYILIPSRRIFYNYPSLPEEYPLITKYYQLLFSGRLGFEKVKEISSFPELSFGHNSIEFPDEQAEETWTVFDHPVIRIYKRTKDLNLGNYQKMFGL